MTTLRVVVNNSGAVHDDLLQAIYVNDDPIKSTLLFSIYWDGYEILSWLDSSLDSLLKEETPVFLPKAKCIAEGILLFYSQTRPMPDRQYDELFNYRTRHGIRFALRGAEIPDFYIGIYEHNLQLSVMKGLTPIFYSLDQLIIDGPDGIKIYQRDF
jgi:hypothetical protein